MNYFKSFAVVFCILYSALMYSQITVSSASVPEIGDVLSYRTFNYVGVDDTYLTIGGDQTWSFSEFDFIDDAEEVYADIAGTALQDSFPEANMIVQLGPFTGAALKTETSIEIIGFDVIDAQQFLGEVRVNRLSSPLILKDTPFEYEDIIEGEFSIPVTFDAALIPGIDSFELPIPGATLDSIRVTTSIYRSEEAEAWGTLEVIGNDFDVLKVKTIDSTATLIEAGLGVFGQTIWFDATAFIGDMGDFLGGNVANTTYKFLSADSKESILEFTQEVELDEIGEIVNVTVTGRMSAQVTSSLDEHLLNSQNISIWRNPVQSELKLNSNLGAISINVYIVDNMGRVIKPAIKHTIGDPINVDGLLSGYYRVIIQHGDKRETIPFIKAD